MNEPKILLLDIETLPIAAKLIKFIVRFYPGSSLGAEMNSIICFGYKWLGDKKAKSISVWDYPGWEKNVNDDSKLCKDIYSICKDADVIVTHNGNRFDIPVINARLLFNKIENLPPIASVDTYSLAKRNMKLSFKRLKDLADFFGTVNKKDTGGWSLWEDVATKDLAACKKMEAYCRGDVDALEQIFLKLRRFAGNIPHCHTGCINCGSTMVAKEGIRRTLKKTFQRLKCRNCGKWFQEKLILHKDGL